MIELPPADFATVMPLFREITHNVPLVYGVLDGCSPGRVLADRSHHPTAALVLTATGDSYVGGEVPAESFDHELEAIFWAERM